MGKLSGVVEWSSGVMEWSSGKVEWSIGVVEWSIGEVEWFSGSHLSTKSGSGKENPKSCKETQNLVRFL